MAATQFRRPLQGNGRVDLQSHRATPAIGRVLYGAARYTDELNTIRLPDYVTADFTALYALDSRSQFKFSIENIFNEQYETKAGYRAPGRTLDFSFTRTLTWARPYTRPWRKSHRGRHTLSTRSQAEADCNMPKSQTGRSVAPMKLVRLPLSLPTVCAALPPWQCFASASPVSRHRLKQPSRIGWYR